MKKQKNKTTHIVISGYYGYGSIGDETMLAAILSGIAKKLPGSRVCVLCADKSYISEAEGITVTYKVRTNPISVIASLLCADLFISGGGSLIQDATSKRSLSYYCTLIRLAKLCGCKIAVFGNGIGPLNNQRKASRALRLADTVSLRDHDSYALAKDLTDEKAEICLSADPVFAYPFSKSRSPFLACLQSLSGKPFFAVSIRRCVGNRQLNKRALISAILRIKAEGYTPIFVPMQSSFDLELCREIASETCGTVADIRNADDLFCLLEKSSFALGMRLHFLLTAAIAGKPLVALSYDCKVESCIRYLGLSSFVSAFDFTEKELVDAVKNARSSFSRQKCEEKCREMRTLALADMNTLYTLLNESGEKEEQMEKFFADT